MRGSDLGPRVLSAAYALGLGAAAGLVATAAMYGAAGLDFLLTNVPPSSWAASADVAFGGSAGSILGLAGPSLHAVHGAAIGAVVGLGTQVWWGVQPRVVVVAEIGLPAGFALWLAVLGLSPATRATVGPGPPLFLSLGMHLVYGFVVVATVAAKGRRATRFT